jgi:hypothetical protein
MGGEVVGIARSLLDVAGAEFFMLPGGSLPSRVWLADGEEGLRVR